MDTFRALSMLAGRVCGAMAKRASVLSPFGDTDSPGLTCTDGVRVSQCCMSVLLDNLDG